MLDNQPTKRILNCFRKKKLVFPILLVFCIFFKKNKNLTFKTIKI